MSQVVAVENEIKERPILFSSPMVRAILEGRKTQTRRVVTAKYPKQLSIPIEKTVRVEVNSVGLFRCVSSDFPNGGVRYPFPDCPYGKVGDRLWVRETWLVAEDMHSDATPYYKADGEDIPGPWRPSIFMPRKLSRITLEITDIRVERLRDISLKDIQAEGIEIPRNGIHAVEHWREEMFQNWVKGWNAINGKRGFSWESNPFVWAINFTPVRTA